MNSPLTNDLIHFLSQCANAISESANNEVIQQGAAELISKLENVDSKEFSINPYPAIQLLGGIVETPYTFNFAKIAKDLKWRPSPRTDFDAQVMALSTINEMLKLDDLLAGLMFMSPNQVYPEHSHAPQEIYFVLSGSALWFYGGEEGYRQQQPGDILYNHPHDRHGIKSQDESLLALYFLWGNKAANYRY